VLDLQYEKKFGGEILETVYLCWRHISYLWPKKATALSSR